MNQLAHENVQGPCSLAFIKGQHKILMQDCMPLTKVVQKVRSNYNLWYNSLCNNCVLASL
jgi:hypothetical protein